MVTLKDIPTDILTIIQGYQDQLNHYKKMANAFVNITDMKYTIKGTDKPFSVRESEYGLTICSPSIYGGLTISNEDESVTLFEHTHKIDIMISEF